MTPARIVSVVRGKPEMQILGSVIVAEISRISPRGSQQPADSSTQLLTHGWPGKSGPHSTKQTPKLSCSLSFAVLI